MHGRALALAAWSRIRSLRHSLGREIEGLLFPSACPLCGSPLGEESSFCLVCLGRLPSLPITRCRLCARAFPRVRGIGALCLRCRSRRPAFRSATAPTRFRGAARDLVHRFKYGREPWLARPLGVLMAEAVQAEPWQGEIELVVGIPLHWRRARRRGFDQAELLAREIGWCLKVPTIRALIRRRATRPQVTLPREARRRNLEGAFQVRQPTACRERGILLVDDVLTSGATADAAARALRSCGVRRVHLATFAR